ncbi:hypothetical protein RFI_15444 [Reticulomyxa filosa]|uniref:Uncharacterized protein n=1 Tax=Reticulomyxa filosa TaxID=46433 RepID=X6N7M5_RETFI|nr:hypothetical protein RFI_15444 [Reticulomyxa filosa]|eukprot:ETO21759.1 hypothetical protein RFI_15444 [Reticulomyxa filosa]
MEKEMKNESVFKTNLRALVAIYSSVILWIGAWNIMTNCYHYFPKMLDTYFNERMTQNLIYAAIGIAMVWYSGTLYQNAGFQGSNRPFEYFLQGNEKLEQKKDVAPKKNNPGTPIVIDRGESPLTIIIDDKAEKMNVSMDAHPANNNNDDDSNDNDNDNDNDDDVTPQEDSILTPSSTTIWSDEAPMNKGVIVQGGISNARRDSKVSSRKDRKRRRTKRKRRSSSSSNNSGVNWIMKKSKEETMTDSILSKGKEMHVSFLFVLSSLPLPLSVSLPLSSLCSSVCCWKYHTLRFWFLTAISLIGEFLLFIGLFNACDIVYQHKMNSIPLIAKNFFWLFIAGILICNKYVNTFFRILSLISVNMLAVIIQNTLENALRTFIMLHYSIVKPLFLCSTGLLLYVATGSFIGNSFIWLHDTELQTTTSNPYLTLANFHQQRRQYTWKVRLGYFLRAALSFFAQVEHQLGAWEIFDDYLVKPTLRRDIIYIIIGIVGLQWSKALLINACLTPFSVSGIYNNKEETNTLEN